jgi:hypothetical protein
MLPHSGSQNSLLSKLKPYLDLSPSQTALSGSRNWGQLVEYKAKTSKYQNTHVYCQCAQGRANS